MRRALFLIAAALAVPAVVIFRRHRDALTVWPFADIEGDAVPPRDTYLDDLLAAFCTLACGCNGQWRASRCPSLIGCGRCVSEYDLR